MVGAFLIIAGLGLIGNGLAVTRHAHHKVFSGIVFYILIRHAKLRKPTNIYLFNLAFADFILLLVSPFISLMHLQRRWDYGKSVHPLSIRKHRPCPEKRVLSWVTFFERGYFRIRPSCGYIRRAYQRDVAVLLESTPPGTRVVRPEFGLR